MGLPQGRGYPPDRIKLQDQDHHTSKWYWYHARVLAP